MGPFLKYTLLTAALRIDDVCARCVHRCKSQSRPSLLVPLHSCLLSKRRFNRIPEVHQQLLKLRSGQRRRQQTPRVFSVTDHAGCLCECNLSTPLLRRSGDFRLCLRFTSLTAALHVVDVCARCVHRYKAQSRPRLLVPFLSCCFSTWVCNLSPKLQKQMYKLRSGRQRKQETLRVLSVTDNAGCLCDWKVCTLLLRRSGDLRFCLRFTSLSAALCIVDVGARCV